MRAITSEKFDALLKFIQEMHLDLLLISDSETNPNVNLRYLSGQPTDATLAIKADGETFLFPWDVQLAKELAEVDEIVDPSSYNNSWEQALQAQLNLKLDLTKAKVGVTLNFPYSSILSLEAQFSGISFSKDAFKIANFLNKLRMTKSNAELALLKEAARIGNQTIQDITRFARKAKHETEKDLDFLVMKKIGEYGGEDVAFPSIVANTDRSYMIHCHPWSSSAPLAKPGLALIDFGAKYNGYSSDITLPLLFGKLSAEQQKMHETIYKAYSAAIDVIHPGVPLWKISDIATSVIEQAGYKMPHSLGHGLGLTVHDSPAISSKPKDPIKLKYWEEVVAEDGMVFTIEPGVYVHGIGGTRLENDVVIQKGKVEVITKAEFIHIT